MKGRREGKRRSGEEKRKGGGEGGRGKGEIGPIVQGQKTAFREEEGEGGEFAELLAELIP
jgi:hypothetical protein